MGGEGAELRAGGLAGRLRLVPLPAPPAHRARGRLLDQQHHVLRGLGLGLLLSHLCDHAHRLHVGPGRHQAGLPPDRGSCQPTG